MRHVVKRKGGRMRTKVRTACGERFILDARVLLSGTLYKGGSVQKVFFEGSNADDSRGCVLYDEGQALLKMVRASRQPFFFFRSCFLLLYASRC